MMPSSLSSAQVLVFDLMGTCTDWHTSITLAISRLPVPANLEPSELRSLAIEWRAEFFRYILDSFARGEQSPDIDIVHHQVLNKLLTKHNVGYDVWNTAAREQLVEAWHFQQRTSTNGSRYFYAR